MNIYCIYKYYIYICRNEGILTSFFVCLSDMSLHQPDPKRPLTRDPQHIQGIQPKCLGTRMV